MRACAEWARRDRLATPNDLRQACRVPLPGYASWDWSAEANDARLLASRNVSPWNRPNLYVLGAPKCGTTAFCNYLRQHPDIFVPPKELHYFGEDLAFRNKPRPTEEQFAQRYATAQGQAYRADCAIRYLFSHSAAREIRSACPDAKLIALLRKPSQMGIRLHSEFLYQGDEDIAEFASAIAAEGDRARGLRIPPSSTSPGRCSIARSPGTASRSPVTPLFPRDQVHVVLYDDLVADTPAAYVEALRFLGLDESFRAELDVVNPNKVVRSPGFRQLLREPPAPIRNVGRLVVRNQRTRSVIGKRLLDLNTVAAARTPLDPAMALELDQVYADDVERLSLLIYRDLTSWLPDS